MYNGKEIFYELRLLLLKPQFLEQTIFSRDLFNIILF